jgi:hypothetical protein
MTWARALCDAAFSKKSWEGLDEKGIQGFDGEGDCGAGH